MSNIRPTTTDAILEAAFQVYNLDPTASLAEIAKRAGVGRATLHRHFAGRDTLMTALSERATQELDEAVERATKNAISYTDGLRLSLNAIIPLGDRQWFLSHEHTDEAKQAADTAELVSAIGAAKDEGTFDQNVPNSWIAETYENLIYAAWTLIRKGEATPSQASDFAWRTLTTGLQGPSK